ncbi:hypothetical protein M8J76_015743 [Diaphorina citri]|nr:hypothetical protein M8J76_015743 [Diaphorina citri]
MLKPVILSVKSVYKKVFSKKSKNWNDLFPSKASFLFFNMYILFCVLHALIISASQDKNKGYEYNYIVVVLLTDLLKLIISFLLFWKNNPFSSFVSQFNNNHNLLWLYLIPALLYCIYNNLVFVSLSQFDPTTYSLLLQIRVVITGVLFQILFKKRLSLIQWISLLTLMSGCMIKELNLSDDWSATHVLDGGNTVNFSFGFNICFILIQVSINICFILIQVSFNICFILIQVLCSCTAGVYNEFLLKKNGGSVNTLVQNIFMYLDSILVNGVILVWKYDWSEMFSVKAIESLLHFKVLIVMLNNAALGITTSFFLKNLNSILKTFASALELSLVAILSRIFLNVPIMLNTVVSICVVSLAVVIYTQNPVTNVKKMEEEEKPMLGRDAEGIA